MQAPLNVTMMVQKVISQLKGFDLFGGNCGVFANAMCRYLSEHGHKCRLALVGDNEEGEYDEHHLYHVAFVVDNLFYDGDGLIGDINKFYKYADKFAAEYYNNPNPALHAYDFDINQARHVRTNTNYSISEDALYDRIKKIAETW